MNARRTPRALAAVALAAALVLTACGDKQDDTVAHTGTGTGTTSGSCQDAATVATADPADPTVPKQAATKLQVEDLVVGCGEAIPEGKIVYVRVNYVGKSQSTGDVFDSSWDNGAPVEFPVGAGRLIAGWDQGLVGMKVGGRRQLTVPGDLGYGPQGSPPRIGPNETLTFVLDLLAVSDEPLTPGP